MAEHIIEENTAEREPLVPIIARIVGIYVALMVVGYFVGNMIYQIP